MTVVQHSGILKYTFIYIYLICKIVYTGTCFKVQSSVWKYQNGKKKILSTNISLGFANVSNEPAQRLAPAGYRIYPHLSLSQESTGIVLAVITTQQTPPRHGIQLESGQAISVTTATLLTESFSLSQVIMPQSRRLQREEKAAIPAFSVCIHLHMTRINSRVNNSPGSSSQLRLRWDVNKHGLMILSQAVHNVGTKLEHLVIHVCRKRTQRLKSQHVSASALPRLVNLGKKHNYSALPTISCYHTASSGWRYLDLGETDWERRCAHISPASRHWTSTLEIWSGYFQRNHIYSQNVNRRVLSSHQPVLHHVSWR